MVIIPILNSFRNVSCIVSELVAVELTYLDWMKVLEMNSVANLVSIEF